MNLSNHKQTTNLSNLNSFLFCLIFRFLSSFLIGSCQHPDEYWQSLEVAHNQVFGYGYLSWEWTSKEPLRNPIHMLFFSIFYYILKMTHLDFPWLVAYGPMFWNSIIGAIFDISYIKLARLFTDTNIYVLLIINYTNWWSLNALPRTLINSFEAAFTILAYYLWKISFDHGQRGKEWIARAIIALLFATRPTSIMIWMPIWKGANFYGTSDLFWFFKAFIPYILLAWLPLLIIGLFAHIKNSKAKIPELPFVIIITILMMSTSAHKEERFLTSLLPMMFIMIAEGIAYGLEVITSKKFWHTTLFIIILTNLIFFGYYQKLFKFGQIEIMSALRQEKQITGVLYFTYCHRTPFYTHLHRDVPMIFPDCSPFFELDFVNEERRLMLNPSYFIEDWIIRYNPSHIVAGDDMLNEDNYKVLTEDYGFKEIGKFFSEFDFSRQDNVYYRLYRKEPNNMRL